MPFATLSNGGHFAMSQNPRFANQLPISFFATLLYLSCLQYTMYVSNSPSLLSSLFSRYFHCTSLILRISILLFPSPRKPCRCLHVQYVGCSQHPSVYLHSFYTIYFMAIVEISENF